MIIMPPYQKILELVEAKKLDISTVNLAKITGEFLIYVKNLELQSQKNHQILADFIGIAAKLLLIKSKMLLPTLELTEDEEEDIQELKHRLLIYQNHQIAAKTLENIWPLLPRSFSRSYLAFSASSFTSPNFRINDLLSAFQAVLAEQANQLPPPLETAKIKIVSLQEKIKELIQRLANQPRHNFSNLVSNADRGEIIATFLAILHLLKDQNLEAQQSENFGEIYLKKIVLS